MQCERLQATIVCPCVCNGWLSMVSLKNCACLLACLLACDRLGISDGRMFVAQRLSPIGHAL